MVWYHAFPAALIVEASSWKEERNVNFQQGSKYEQ